MFIFFLSFIQFINKFVTNFHHRKHFFTDKFKRKILLKIWKVKTSWRSATWKLHNIMKWHIEFVPFETNIYLYMLEVGINFELILHSRWFNRVRSIHTITLRRNVLKIQMILRARLISTSSYCWWAIRYLLSMMDLIYCYTEHALYIHMAYSCIHLTVWRQRILCVNKCNIRALKRPTNHVGELCLRAINVSFFRKYMTTSATFIGILDFY